MTREPTITINGTQLTVPQAMTVRNALEGMACFLVDNGLGDDDHGKFMVASYMQSIHEIRRMIFIAESMQTTTGEDLDRICRVIRRDGETDEGFRYRAMYGSGI